MLPLAALPAATPGDRVRAAARAAAEAGELPPEAGEEGPREARRRAASAAAAKAGVEADASAAAAAAAALHAAGSGALGDGAAGADDACTCPPFAVKATCGKRPIMEDTYALVFGSAVEAASLDKLHFFGVYDGHGGIQASQHCAARLHHHLSAGAERDGGGAGAGDDDAASADGSEGEGEGDGEGPSTSMCVLLEQALREAFLKTDEEFSADGTAGLVGSTAVCALVGTHRVWIANCGDSRAVLCRGGQAVQVTDDHKPEREDEAERVEKAGGQVLYWNGHRVMGVLAMSRAIGDHCLRPYVIPEPEITVFKRHSKDEILLLASDGLWDVMPNQEATDLAMRCIRRARDKGASPKAAARVAATILTKAAVDRGSRDNITVMVIDL
ncbi:MAG: phosphatase 2C-like domain-containing protein, partial [Monoraphidium minutum]